MQWRNEQIYHLRQKSVLTEQDQEYYFNEVVAKLFEQTKPEQILFSYLKNGECIGYGGLVHINWLDKNAEISFLMKTELEEIEFHQHWKIFLELIEQVAFNELDIHKLYTYAFDLRPHLYEVLESAEYYRDAVLKEHCFFNNSFKDVIIHSKINQHIKLREATKKDMELFYEWANDESVRKMSFNSDYISFET
ncbi:MAG: GNAT family N-acetyltransferase, partial [Ignavibacteriae bacterium]|nr:GNAT family N-acetyltransferase [Ignavibacteriota bacterium]